jgi:5-methylcytosine-specific restriction endonuclease McrA
MLGAVVWNARSAVRWRERRDRGLVACVDCGTVCEGRNVMDGHDAVPWEADHQVPLEDGGPHTLDNLRARCVPCHAIKTADEARCRAYARRGRVVT